MSKEKITILVLIVGMTGVIGYFVGNAFLGGSKMKPVDVETARVITVDGYSEPDPEVFNLGAINPTTTINISPNDQNPIGR